MIEYDVINKIYSMLFWFTLFHFISFHFILFYFLPSTNKDDLDSFETEGTMVKNFQRSSADHELRIPHLLRTVGCAVYCCSSYFVLFLFFVIHLHFFMHILFFWFLRFCIWNVVRPTDLFCVCVCVSVWVNLYTVTAIMIIET